MMLDSQILLYEILNTFKSSTQSNLNFRIVVANFIEAIKYCSNYVLKWYLSAFKYWQLLQHHCINLRYSMGGGPRSQLIQIRVQEQTLAGTGEDIRLLISMTTLLDTLEAAMRGLWRATHRISSSCIKIKGQSLRLIFVLNKWVPK